MSFHADGDRTHDQIDSMLKHLFSPYGHIESVSVCRLNDHGAVCALFSRFAHVTFSQAKSVDRIIDSCFHSNGISSERSLVLEQWWVNVFGLNSSIVMSKTCFIDTITQSPSIIQLQQESDVFMSEFESAELKQAMAIRASANQPDEDGFMLVTHQGRVKGAKGSKMTRRKRRRQSGHLSTDSIHV